MGHLHAFEPGDLYLEEALEGPQEGPPPEIDSDLAGF
jgi:hypothetical protein